MSELNVTVLAPQLNSVLCLDENYLKRNILSSIPKNDGEKNQVCDTLLCDLLPDFIQMF